MKHLSVILLTLFLLMGCSAKPAVVDLGGKPVTYPTVEVMEFDSDLIVTGKTLSTDSRIERLVDDQVTAVLTLTQFRIDTVEKGNAKPGDIITIWQDSAYDEETNTIYLFGATSPLAEYEEYRLYLKLREPGSEYYIPVSSQGIRPNP